MAAVIDMRVLTPDRHRRARIDGETARISGAAVIAELAEASFPAVKARIAPSPSPFAPVVLLTRRGIVAPSPHFCRATQRADALQCQAQSDAFINDATQFLGQRDARVLRGERR